MLNSLSNDWFAVLDAVSSPDIQTLIDIEPELKKYTIGRTYKIDGNRKRQKTEEPLKLSYTTDSIRLVSRAILRRWFNIDLILDSCHLCPRIPNRLHYVLWVFFDLLGARPLKERPVILDVGIGASCIYPLLAAVVCPDARIVGSEINSTSLALGQKNLELNVELAKRISLIKVDEQDTFFNEKVIEAAGGKLDVCMCNPPFYSSREELVSRKNSKLDDPFTLLIATDNELFTAGGEEEFVLRMVHQSCRMPINTITWYTTMVGKKSTFELVIEKFRKLNITNYCGNELVQGSSTRRWLIAWTFTAFHGRSRVYSSSLKHLNPQLFIRKFDVPVDLSFQARLKACLESLPIVLIDAQSAIEVHTHGDVWSRSFRRKSPDQQKTQLDNIYNIHRFRIEWATGELSIWFYYGDETRIYESFIGFIQKNVL